VTVWMGSTMAVTTLEDILVYTNPLLCLGDLESGRNHGFFFARIERQSGPLAGRVTLAQVPTCLTASLGDLTKLELDA
jgi:hypothetical protein